MEENADTARARRVLIVSTIVFSICFAAWVINSVLITYLVNSGIFDFNETEVGWLLAFPILTGAISRVPLGILTDRYGGKPLFMAVMVFVSAAMIYLSYAETYADFFVASLCYGIAGGSFAVGVGYVSICTPKEKQGTALGIFGMGNAGAAGTTLFAPTLLEFLTDHGANPEGWRMLPRAYAVLIVCAGIAFFVATRNRASGIEKTLAERLSPLRSVIVWRFGFYYFLVFGGFVTLAQWIVPYSVNVYNLSLAEAGLIASCFSLPSGVIRAAGGWLSDKFGARTVMVWVFLITGLASAMLSVPRMVVSSPGEGVMARAPGVVKVTGEDGISVGEKRYQLIERPDAMPAEKDEGQMWLPTVSMWQEPTVTVGQEIGRKEMIAKGVTNIYYPANFWMFAALVIVIGMTTGIGKAGVFKFIPEHFPDQVGAVGGMVGLLGAMGGFVLPPVFGYLLKGTGLWSTCWIVLAVLSFICLLWMEINHRRLMRREAPELSELVEARPSLALQKPLAIGGEAARTVEDLLSRVPFFSALPPEQTKSLAKIAAYESIRAGELVFSEGDPGDRLYVILQGKVEISRRSKDDAIALATFGPGDYFGELALIDGQPRSATARTVEGSDFLLIGRNDFLDLISKSKQTLAHVLVGLSTRIRSSLEKVGK